MNSQTDTETGWQPGSTSPLIPTLLLLCGPLPDEDANYIQQSVQNRLGDQVPPSTVAWGRLGSADDIFEEAIAELVAPMTKQRFWDGMVARGYAQVIPYPISLRIIVVYDLAEGDDVESAHVLLQQLATVAQNVLVGTAEFSLELIVFGDGVIDLRKETLYWPRIRLQTEAHSGIVAERRRIIEETQTILVALLSSELTMAIEYIVRTKKEDVGWIWMGASALVVELAHLEEYLRLLILQSLIQPLIQTQLSPANQQFLDRALKDGVAELLKRVEDEAKRITGTISLLESRATTIKPPPLWEFRIEPKGKESGAPREIFSLQEELKDKFELSMVGLTGLLKDQQPPPKELSYLLCGSYARLRESLVENLDKPEGDNYVYLLKSLTNILDRAFEPKGGELIQPLELREKDAVGLPALVYAMERATTELRDSPDLHLDGQVIPVHPLESDYFLTALAEADATAIQAAYRRYFRFCRNLLSWPGIVLKLIPAWPLLTGILAMITHKGEAWSALVAALALTAIGIVDGVFWLVLEKGSRYRQYRAQYEKTLADSVPRLAATILRDYRLSIFRHLSDIFFGLAQLLLLLEDKAEDVSKKLANLKAYLETPNLETSPIYRLDNLTVWSQWARKAIELARPTPYASSKSAQIISEEIFSLPKNQHPEHGEAQVFYPPQPAAYHRVVSEIEAEADRLTRHFFLSSSLEPDARADWENPVGGEPAEAEELAAIRKSLADIRSLEENNPLAGEKRWIWLYTKAHPLGRSQDPAAQSFTIVTLASDAPLQGFAGEYLRKSDWLVARSRHPYEIICLRGVVETAGLEETDDVD